MQPPVAMDTISRPELYCRTLVGTAPHLCVMTLFAGLFQLGALPALASESISLGADVKVHTLTPTGQTELCILPKHYLNYDGQDQDRKEEAELCRLSPYLNQEIKLEFTSSSKLTSKLFKKTDTKDVILCPKLNSTVPGTNFIDVPKGWSAEKAIAEFCIEKLEVPIAIADKYSIEARLKSWFADASASSVLAYYHLSRILDVGRVPPAVYRTLERTSHEPVIKRANELLKGSTEHIANNWRALGDASKNAARGKPSLKIYTPDGKMLYGALSKNAKGEEKYTEVSGVGDFVSRYPRFLAQPPFQKVADPLGVELLAKSNRIETLAPMIIQMRDVSGMVLLDSLLSQDDRIGNIHYKIEVVENTQSGAHSRELTKIEKEAAKEELNKARAHLLDKARIASEQGNAKLAANFRGQSEKIKLTERLVQKALKSLYPGETKILAKVMILKDNDCGVDTDPRRRQNLMRRYGALERLRHMDPETYRRFLQLADDILTDRFRPFAINTLLYREQDYEGTKVSLKENARHALNILKDACRRGDLKLDLTMKFDDRGRFVPEPHPGCE
ncbi:MAG: hypothetical protein J0L82_00800 [Deltaproteobacteria bacterium]|nr:hypothetical protein [Deltaproteobacteria bacterium]